MKSKDTTIKHKLYLTWTEAALDCYEHNCNCYKCLLEDICERQRIINMYDMPPMKYLVLKLLELKGKPNVTEILLNIHKGRHHFKKNNKND